eukprot:Rmarinus@m.17818
MQTTVQADDGFKARENNLFETHDLDVTNKSFLSLHYQIPSKHNESLSLHDSNGKCAEVQPIEALKKRDKPATRRYSFSRVNTAVPKRKTGYCYAQYLMESEHVTPVDIDGTPKPRRPVSAHVGSVHSVTRKIEQVQKPLPRPSSSNVFTTPSKQDLWGSDEEAPTPVKRPMSSIGSRDYGRLEDKATSGSNRGHSASSVEHKGREFAGPSDGLPEDAVPLDIYSDSGDDDSDIDELVAAAGGVGRITRTTDRETAWTATNTTTESCHAGAEATSDDGGTVVSGVRARMSSPLRPSNRRVSSAHPGKRDTTPDRSSGEEYEDFVSPSLAGKAAASATPSASSKLRLRSHKQHRPTSSDARLSSTEAAADTGIHVGSAACGHPHAKSPSVGRNPPPRPHTSLGSASDLEREREALHSRGSAKSPGAGCAISRQASGISASTSTNFFHHSPRTPVRIRAGDGIMRPASAIASVSSVVSGCSSAVIGDEVQMNAVKTKQTYLVTRRYYMPAEPQAKIGNAFMKHYDVILRHDEEAVTNRTAVGTQDINMVPLTRYYMDVIGRFDEVDQWSGRIPPKLKGKASQPMNSMDLEKLRQWVATVTPRSVDDYVPLFTLCQATLLGVINEHFQFHLLEVQRQKTLMGVLNQKLEVEARLFQGRLAKAEEKFEERLGEAKKQFEMEKAEMKTQHAADVENAVLDSQIRCPGCSEKKQRLKDLTQARDSLQRQLDNVQAEASLVRRMQGQVRDLEKIKSDLEKSLGEKAESEKKMKADLIETKKENIRLEKTLATCQKSLQETRDRLMSTMSKEETTRADLEGARKQLAALQQAHETLGLQAEDFKMKVSELREEIARLEAELKLPRDATAPAEDAAEDAGSDVGSDKSDVEVEDGSRPKKRRRRKGAVKASEIVSGSHFERFLGRKRLFACLRTKENAMGDCYKLMAQVFKEKITADEVDDREGNTREDLAEYICEFLLNQYGIKPLADRQLMKLVSTSLTNYNTDPRAKILARFCGLVEPLSRSSLDVTLLVLKTIANAYADKAGGLNSATGQGEVGKFWKNLEKLEDTDFVDPVLMKFVFDRIVIPLGCGDLVLEAIEQVVEQDKVSKLPYLRTFDEETLDVEIRLDYFLGIVAEAADTFETRCYVEQFEEFDENKDGVLSLEEFQEMCRVLNPSLPEKKVKKMFSQILGDFAGEDGELSAEEFSVAARKVGLRAFNLKAVEEASKQKGTGMVWKKRERSNTIVGVKS